MLLPADKFWESYLLLTGLGTVRVVFSSISLFGRRVRPLDLLTAVEVITQKLPDVQMDLEYSTWRDLPLLSWYRLLTVLEPYHVQIGRNELFFNSEFNPTLRIPLSNGEKLLNTIALTRKLANGLFEYRFEPSYQLADCISFSILNNWKSMDSDEFTIRIAENLLSGGSLSVKSIEPNGQWKLGTSKILRLSVESMNSDLIRSAIVIEYQSQPISKHIFLYDCRYKD